jgi:chromosome segregation ATPase
LGQAIATLDEKEQTLRREMAGFLGRMLGFLEGPAGNPATVGTVAATKTRIAGRLNPDEQSVLNSEARTVVARYKEMIGESEDAEREAKDDAEQQRDQLLEDLERQRQRMEERRKELGPQYDKLRDEAKAELEQFAKEERPFSQQLAQLDQQATVVRRELILLNDELSRLRSNIDREKDATVRAALINESSRLSILARRYDADYLGLERRAGSINAQLAEIRGRAQQARQKYAAEFGQIETELSNIEKQAKRNDLDQRKSQRTRISGSTRLTRAIGAKASAIGTYEGFSLESEKERVLSALKE